MWCPPDKNFENSFDLFRTDLIKKCAVFPIPALQFVIWKTQFFLLEVNFSKNCLSRSIQYDHMSQNLSQHITWRYKLNLRYLKKARSLRLRSIRKILKLKFSIRVLKIIQSPWTFCNKMSDKGKFESGKKFDQGIVFSSTPLKWYF